MKRPEDPNFTNRIGVDRAGLREDLDEQKYAIYPGSKSQLLAEQQFRVGMFGIKEPTTDSELLVKAVALNILEDETNPTIVTGASQGVNKVILDCSVMKQKGAITFLPRPMIHRKMIDANNPRVPKDLRNTFNTVLDLGSIEERDPDEVYHSVLVEAGGAVLSSFQRENFIGSEETMLKWLGDIVSWSDCFLPFGLLEGTTSNTLIYQATLQALKHGKPVFVEEKISNDKEYVLKAIKPFAPPFVLFYESLEELQVLLKGMKEMLSKGTSNS